MTKLCRRDFAPSMSPKNLNQYISLPGHRRSVRQLLARKCLTNYKSLTCQLQTFYFNLNPELSLDAEEANHSLYRHWWQCNA